MRDPKVRLAGATALATAALTATIGLTATAAWLISRAAQQPPILYLMVAITAVRAFGLGRAVFRYAERLVAHDAAFRILADLRVRVYEGLSRVIRVERQRGDLLSRLVADVDSVQDRYLRFLIPAAAAAEVGTTVSLFQGAIVPAAGLATAAGLLATGALIPWAAARSSARAEAKIAPAKGDLAAGVLDLLRGAPELVAADAAAGWLAKVGEQDRALTAAEKRSAAAAGLGAALTALATGATVGACAIVGIDAVHRGTLPGVLLAVLVLTPLAAFEATAAMPQAARSLTRFRSAERRISEIVDEEATVHEPAEPTPLPTGGPHRVEISGLTVHWPGRDHPALSDVTLTLAPGRRVAVIGPSGSGKTTLVNALLRFVEPSGGAITLDGVDTRHLAGEDVRRVIGLCAQDAHIFDSTLRENLRLAKPGAPDAELHEALGSARLDEWVAGLPQGLDTFVGEHGARLSGGQRQRVALARALLAGFPVLLLDEPTEHLDLPTADALAADLLEMASLIVTHRLTGLEGVDEIVVLDQGRVVERGTWDELLSAEGAFHSLWRREQSVGGAIGAIEAAGAVRAIG